MQCFEKKNRSNLHSIVSKMCLPLQNDIFVLLLMAVCIAQCLNIKACDEKWVQIEGQCLYVSKDIADFNGAKSKCLRLSGKLFEPKNEGLNEAVFKLANQTINFFWYFIGIQESSEQTGHFEYSSTGKALTFTKFQDGQPNGNGTQNCVMVGIDGTEFWSDVDCKARLKYVCQRLTGDEVITAKMINEAQTKSVKTVVLVLSSFVSLSILAFVFHMRRLVFRDQ